MDIKLIKKCQSSQKEYLILNPPYTIFGSPSIPTSNSIIMRVEGLRKMIKDLSDKDSFRIEWFAGNKATEFSFLKENSKVDE